MTQMFRLEADYSTPAVNRRIKEEMARAGVNTEAAAAEMAHHNQQWVSRRFTGSAKWAVEDLWQFCAALGLDYDYVAVGIRSVPEPPGADRTNPRSGTVIAFPSRRIDRPRSDALADVIDDAAESYVALADDSLLLPRLDSNQEPPD